MVYGTVPGVNPCGNAAEQYFSQVRVGLGLGLARYVSQVAEVRVRVRLARYFSPVQATGARMC
jgi:hypothetical protein